MRRPPPSNVPSLTEPSDAIALAQTDDMNVGLLVRHAFRSFARRLQDVILPFGLSAAEFRVLRVLETIGSLTQLQIATLAGMDRPYAALIAKQLREKGLVEAKSDPRDGRRVLLHPTAEGARVSGTIAGQLNGVNSSAVDEIGADDLATFCDVIARIRRNLDGIEPAAMARADTPDPEASSG